MIHLPNVTLLVVDCVDYARARKAFDHCQQHITFSAQKLLTHFDVSDKDAVTIPQIKTIREYSDFMVRDLSKYFDTEFVLVAQWDGFVWQPEFWNNEFLKYDYIGAPWPANLVKPGVPKHFNVGNGGFSIRSKRLQDFLSTDNNLVEDTNEDVTICQFNRAYLEKCGFTFAPFELAMQFAWECLPQPARNSFGMHGRFTIDDLPKLRFVD